jgi:hypothetical protein
METRQRRSFTDDYKRQAVDLVASRSMLRRTATCWPTSLSIVLPNVLLHEEQSTRRVVLRPPSALSKMCSGLVFSVNSFSQKMHLAISRLSKLSGWSFFLELVRAAGVEPAQAFRPYGFSYQLRLSPPRLGAFALRLVCGLDYPFTVAFTHCGVRLRCCPSSLYTFPRSRAWLGIATLEVPPNLSSSASSVSQRALKLSKSVASTSFATPASIQRCIASASGSAKRKAQGRRLG